MANQAASRRFTPLSIVLALTVIIVVGIMIPNIYSIWQVSYSIYGPYKYYLDETTPSQDAQRLKGFDISIWNSGWVILKNSEAQFVFKNSSPGFKIVSVYSDALNNFKEAIPDQTALYPATAKVTYSQLNLGQKDIVKFLVLGDAELEVNFPGDRIVAKKDDGSASVWSTVFIIVLAAIAGIMAHNAISRLLRSGT